MKKITWLLIFSFVFSAASPLLVFPAFALAQTNTTPLQVTCTSSASAGTVTFTANAIGGTGSYIYNWTANGSVATTSLPNNVSSVFTFPVNTATPESAVIAVTDGQNNATASCATVIPIIEPLVGYCSVEVLPESFQNPQTSPPERTVNYKVAVGGGTGTYSYVWTGTNGLFSTTQDINQMYTAPGLETATVTITSGDQTAQLTCTANLTEVNFVPFSQNQNGEENSLGGSCSLNTQTPSTQAPVTWSAETEGVASSSIAWSGSAGGNGQTYTTQYSTPGIQTANVTFSTADGQNLQLTCQALLSSSTDTIAGINGCFIATAAWGTPDAPEVVALRTFRDDKLLTTTLGTDFVNTYYAVSPPIANVIRDSTPLKWIVRMLLKPVAYVAQQIDQKQ